MRFRPALSPGLRWGSSRCCPDPIVGCWGGDTILPLRRSPLTLGAIGASVWRGDDPPNISPIEQRVMEHLTLLILYYKVTLLQSGKSAGYAAGYDK